MKIGDLIDTVEADRLHSAEYRNKQVQVRVIAFGRVTRLNVVDTEYGINGELVLVTDCEVGFD